MKPTLKPFPKAAYFCIFLFIVFCSFLFAYNRALNALERTGEIRVEQFADRLLGQLSDYKTLPVLLANHPQVRRALTDDPTNTNNFLLNASLLSGTEKIFIINKSGDIIASSDFNETHSSIGKNVAHRPDIKASLNGRLGFYHTKETDQTRGIYFTAAMFDEGGPTLGSIGLRINVEALEFEWHIDEVPVAFFDRNEVVFITNRSELKLRQLDQANIAETNIPQFDRNQIIPFYAFRAAKVFGYNIWRFKGTTELPNSSLIVERYVPQVGMTARAFVDTSPAIRSAQLQCLLIAALLGLIWLRSQFLTQKRNRLADLLNTEEQANAALEERVESRTNQLRATQHQLVQAGKLTALGQMAAGISHELNQPLAALQNYAENGQKLISLDRIDDADANFVFINDQVQRMSRIIKSLRAFARKEKETIEIVDLQQIVNESLQLSKNRLEQEGIKTTKTGSENTILVHGGHVRLQQVFINILNNAADALISQKEKCISLHMSDLGQVVITDTGPGISNTNRLFEPFYSTKEQGASKGMGLGLSISYGILGSFGGDLTARNHPDGGAEFTLTLKLSEQVQSS